MNFRTMRDVGFLNRIRQTPAFYQMLAMSSWHLAHLNQSQEMTDHFRYAIVATRELQKQINDSRQSTTDDAISAVLAFACCSVSQATHLSSTNQTYLVDTLTRLGFVESAHGWLGTNVARTRRLSNIVLKFITEDNALLVDKYLYYK
jgi:hypothetical protein